MTATLERSDFPAGYEATERTIARLARAVRERYLHPRIRARARQLFAGLPSLDVAGEMHAVWNHVTNGVRYMRDPVGVEYITDPVTLDEQLDAGEAAEDCESMALYAATLFAAAGLPSRFEAQGRDRARPKRFTHCSLRVKNPRTGAWVSFDPVGAAEFPGVFDLGDTLHQAGEPIEWWDLDGKRVTTMTKDDLFGASDDSSSMLGAALGDTAGDIVGGITKGLNAIAPALGPYGGIASGAAGLTSGIYGLATGKQLPAAPKVVTPPPSLGARRRIPIAAVATYGNSPELRALAASQAAAGSSSSALPAVAGIAGAALLAKLLF